MNFRLPPDLYEFAVNLRQVVENDNAINQGLMFALGRSNRLKVRTLAGMAKCSQSHVRRMLLVANLPDRFASAIAEGAPYTWFIRSLRPEGCNPNSDLPDTCLTPTRRQVSYLG
jgi:hypothetical protein